MGRKQYSEQFKQDAVKLVTEQGYSVSKAAKSLGISPTALINWRDAMAPAQEADLQAELLKLRKENRELRMEREILKKAATFFAKENQ